MAGRIVPVVLAAVIGVSIGVATFDGEFKEQRRKKLQEEYDREVAAQAALSGQGLAPMSSNAIPPPAPRQHPAPHVGKKEETQSPAPDSKSDWSSMLGLWAWDKNLKKDAAAGARQPAPAQTKVDGTSGKP